MPPAIIGGAIAAAGAVGGAVLGGKAASKAAKTSAASADAATAAQRQTYGENKALLSPYVNAGLPATQAINALLGLSSGQPAPQAAAPATPAASPITIGGNGIRGLINSLSQPKQTVAPAGTQPTAAPVNYNQAFDNYRNSTGYQFRLNEGMNALNSGYAGAGTIKSGAAMKASQDYGQGIASQEFGNYLNSLGNQQAMGLSAASATAGVGQNFANSLGSIAMANGSNQANAALLKGQIAGQAVNSLATIGANYFGGK